MRRGWLIASALSLALCVLSASADTANRHVTARHPTPEYDQPLIYTRAQLSAYGLTDTEIKHYRSRMQTIQGQWWGHLSPIEFLMYSARDETEQKYFARLYLESTFPKALAERNAMQAMYQVARDVYAEQIGPNQSATVESRSALFVDYLCLSCKQKVKELVGLGEGRVDIYVTNLHQIDSQNQALVEWARSMNLPGSKITLNYDNGLYARKFGQELTQLHWIPQS